MTKKYEAENVRSIYNTEISEVQKKYLNEDIHDLYPYIYVGKVVDTTDPLKLGRIKVSVINLFDELTKSDMPWFLPINSNIKGSWCIPDIDDYVEVIFERGDIYCGKYLGKAINKSQIPSQSTGVTNYPDTMILFETDNGAYCSVNKKTGEYKVVHPSGSQIRMDALGAVEIDAISFKIKSSPSSVGGGVVVPNASNLGGLSCIPVCPMTSQPHNGCVMYNTP